MTAPSNVGHRFVGRLLFAAGIICLDQLSKHAILARFVPYETLTITPFFNLVLAFNTGAAFSFLAGAGGWQKGFFVALTLAVSAWLDAMIRHHAGERLLPLSASLILGGALGNVVDRIRMDMVVDFVQVHWAGWYFPAFNVADSAITIGAILMLWQQFRVEGQSA